PALLNAQDRTRCEYQSDRFSADSTPTGNVILMGGNVRITCKSRNLTLRGDSAEQRPDGYHVIGHAIYDEPRFHVTSDFLNYYPIDERILAVGNVNARLPSGSTMVGPIAEYKRAAPRIRTRDSVIARSR